MGNVSAIGAASGANPATETYQYDPLYRLGSVTEASGTVLESYTYNPTGDRLSKTASGLATGAYLYTTGTHQLKSIGNAPQTSDANGNITGSVIGAGTYGLAYNGRNRLSLAQLNGSTVGTYSYNALGQRIGKVTTTAERYGYNENGQLLAEYGATNRDYLWMDDVPVAVVDNTINGSVTTSTINYITADQLNTPRAVTSSAGAVIWQWAYQGNSFGEQQPTSTAGYVLNLRYAGQYYDAETGLISNGFRDCYVSATGRYCQSDPTGLDGGINTYDYVENSPLDNVDPLGLDDTQCMYNRTACGWAPSTPTDANASVGVSEAGAVATGVETTELGFAADTTPNMCFYASACGTVGTAAGGGGSVGGTGSIGTGALSDGDSDTALAGVEGGDGAVAGGSVQYDPSSHQISLAKGYLGVGGGVWAGILKCRTHYYCARKPPKPKPPCKGSASK
jgi:RHS repeat-associated protein